MKNLWGELPTGDDIIPPVTILKTQAELLTSHYKGVLMGEVTPIDGRNNEIRYNLSIVAPSLNGYTFQVATLVNPITLYPCRLLDRTDNTYSDLLLNNEALEVALGKILSSTTVRKVIAALLAQSRA